MRADIFKFDNPIEYLQTVLNERKSKNSRYSLRAFSGQLGFKSPSTISSILSGNRKLSLSTALQISSHLGHTPKEARYLELLIHLEKNLERDQKSRVLDELRTIKPDMKYEKHSLDTFRLIADWYHLAIVALSKKANFDLTPSSVSEAFGAEVSKNQAKVALDRLDRLGFINKNNQKTNSDPVLFGDSIKDNAVKQYHKDVIKKGYEAIETQSLNERNLRGSAICLKKENYQKACEIIERCHKEILNLSSKDGDDVYQSNTQLFKLTKFQN